MQSSEVAADCTGSILMPVVIKMLCQDLCIAMLCHQALLSILVLYEWLRRGCLSITLLFYNYL